MRLANFFGSVLLIRTSKCVSWLILIFVFWSTSHNELLVLSLIWFPASVIPTLQFFLTIPCFMPVKTQWSSGIMKEKPKRKYDSLEVLASWFCYRFVIQIIYSVNKAIGGNFLEQEGGKSECIDVISVLFPAGLLKRYWDLKAFCDFVHT